MRTSKNADTGIQASKIADDQLILTSLRQCQNNERCTLGIRFLQNSFMGRVTEQTQDSSTSQGLHNIRINFDYDIWHVKSVQRRAHFAPNATESAEYNVLLQFLNWNPDAP